MDWGASRRTAPLVKVGVEPLPARLVVCTQRNHIEVTAVVAGEDEEVGLAPGVLGKPLKVSTLRPGLRVAGAFDQFRERAGESLLLNAELPDLIRNVAQVTPGASGFRLA